MTAADFIAKAADLIFTGFLWVLFFALFLTVYKVTFKSKSRRGGG